MDGFKFNNKDLSPIVAQLESRNPIYDLVEREKQKSRELLDIVSKAQMEKEEEEERKHREVIEHLAQINRTLEFNFGELNATLDFLLNSLGGNFQRVQAEQLRSNVALAELNAIIVKKDENGFKRFLQDHGVEAIGLVLQMIGIISSQSQRTLPLSAKWNQLTETRKKSCSQIQLSRSYDAFKSDELQPHGARRLAGHHRSGRFGQRRALFRDCG